MNMFLHNIGEIDSETFIYFPCRCLAADEGKRYDYRTNVHHTLKKKPLVLKDLQYFIDCYNPLNRHDRKEAFSEENPEGRWRKYSCEEIYAKDKTSLDIFWLKDKSLSDLDNLPDPDILANEISENIEAGLESFKEIMATLNGESEQVK